MVDRLEDEKERMKKAHKQECSSLQYEARVSIDAQKRHLIDFIEQAKLEKDERAVDQEQ